MIYYLSVLLTLLAKSHGLELHFGSSRSYERYIYLCISPRTYFQNPCASCENKTARS